MQEDGLIVIEHRNFKIVITGAPADTTLPTFVKNLKMAGVTDLVRTCEPSYSTEMVEKEGVKTHEMMFPDGAAPPEELLRQWNELIVTRYNAKDPADAGLVAVHCVAGLGRAPLMAAVALIEMTAIQPLDAIEKIRTRQNGAINARQLKFLQNYKRTNQKNGQCGCVIA
eukprot:TRINITY_DN50144_c0_g1_i1.p1 TRINITY_DN50144_c0_g1~~TRINITY_DN50144_c0_g1_i1.p1  ORF type:complete len:169 (-),score=26.12 TRINITY_DN50144_c0_g1_i1:224-730(-)